MSLQLDIWWLYLMLGLSVASVLVSIALSLAARRLRRDTPHVTYLEQVSFTMQARGDLFRLVSQLAWLALLIVFICSAHPNVAALVACWVTGQGTIPLHSLLLLRSTRRGVRSVPGSSLDRPQATAPPPAPPDPSRTKE